MFKSLLLCAICAMTFSACEKQKQASAEVGAIPKQMIDKATKAADEMSKAQALAAEQLKAAENPNAPADAAQ